MTLVASDLLMPAGKRENGPGMVELRGGLPGVRHVTAEAVCAELILVRFLVAASTVAAQTKERLIEILHFDLQAGGGGDLCHSMAALASLLAVLSLQGKASLRAVIEARPVQRNECVFRTAMFRVTARAICRPRGTFIGARVKTFARLQPALDLHVTIDALQTPRSKIVTRSALGHSPKVRVCARQGARCQLRPSGAAPEHAPGREQNQPWRTSRQPPGGSRREGPAWSGTRDASPLLPRSCQSCAYDAEGSSCLQCPNRPREYVRADVMSTWSDSTITCSALQFPLPSA